MIRKGNRSTMIRINFLTLVIPIAGVLKSTQLISRIRIHRKSNKRFNCNRINILFKVSNSSNSNNNRLWWTRKTYRTRINLRIISIRITFSISLIDIGWLRINIQSSSRYILLQYLLIRILRISSRIWRRNLKWNARIKLNNWRFIQKRMKRMG